MSKITILFFIFALLTIGLWVLPRRQQPRCGAEGFAAQSVDGNYVIDLLGNLKRMSATLADPQMWKERIDMIQKSPVDLAREYIQKHGV